MPATNLSASFTITAYSGPGDLNTAAVFTGVTSYLVDVARGILTLYFAGNVIKEFSLNGITTFTVTVSSGNQTVTVS